MTIDDDSTWLDALAGRVASENSVAAREAVVLRAGILARRAVEDDPRVPPQDASRETALLARARREGLLPRRKATGWMAWWTPGRGVLAVAALACVAVAIGLLSRPGVERQPVRSDPAGIVRLEAQDPLRLQQQLLDALRGLGVDARGYERFDRRGVDADLPQPVPLEVQRVLERHGIPLPADGVLRVEIAAAAEE